MSDPVRLSHTAALILKTLKEGHGYGFQIMEVTGLPSGTVYPALRRMENDGLIEGTWESEAKARRDERPARRYYKPTRAGGQTLIEAEKRYPLIAQFAKGSGGEGMKPHQQMLRLHRTLRFAARLVPANQREGWRAEWVAELTYLLGQSPHAAEQHARGMLTDALAMRWISVVNRWRAIDWRSPELCLRILFSIFALLSAVAMSQSALRHLIFSRWGFATSAVFLVLALFTVPSTVVVSRFGACDAYEGDAASNRQRIARWTFLGTKLCFAVLISYLLAVELTHPMYRVIHVLANSFLLIFGMVFNVIAIGWVFNDQRERCPTCMRLLRSPARMGPPSWSLLDSNATEEMCDRGHGLLHQPQWQTSWFYNARWLALDRTWRGLFRP